MLNMSLLQVKVSATLKKAIQEHADFYDVPSTTLVKIVLAEKFLNQYKAGNIFNADRDNNGKGIDMNNFLEMLND